MKSLVTIAVLLVVGAALAAAASAVGISPLFVVGACAVAWFLIPDAKPESPESPEDLKRRNAISIRQTLDGIDPPLSEEDYRKAFKRLRRACEQGRTRIWINNGGERVEVKINHV